MFPLTLSKCNVSQYFKKSTETGCRLLQTKETYLICSVKTNKQPEQDEKSLEQIHKFHMGPMFRVSAKYKLGISFV